MHRDLKQSRRGRMALDTVSRPLLWRPLGLWVLSCNAIVIGRWEPTCPVVRGDLLLPGDDWPSKASHGKSTDWGNKVGLVDHTCTSCLAEALCADYVRRAVGGNARIGRSAIADTPAQTFHFGGTAIVDPAAFASAHPRHRLFQVIDRNPAQAGYTATFLVPMQVHRLAHWQLTSKPTR